MKVSIIVSSFLLANVNAFSPKALHSDSATALNLLPNQGCQLAAANAAAFAQEELKDCDKSSILEEDKTTPTNAARAFASRLFNLPSQIMNSPPESMEFGLPFRFASDNKADVVVYPIVGFTFVKLENNQMRVFPSSNAKGECNISNCHKSRTEPTYGWFSPCCKLGNLHSEDNVEYCGKKNRRQ